jgi:outer membrane protein, multidrug efflux system
VNRPNPMSLEAASVSTPMFPMNRPATIGRAWRVGLTAVAVAALSACTSLAPTYERPADAVPAQVPGAEAGTPASPMAWGDFVRDERLRKLVEQSLANNRDLRVAVLNVRKAEAQLGVARADRWPTVNGVLSGTRAPSTSTGQQTNTFQAGVQISAWELDFFGRIDSLTQAAQANLLATEAGRRSAELTLVSGVLSADRTLAADRAVLALAQRTLEARRTTLKLAQLRFNRGASSLLELQSVQSLSSQAEASVAAAERQVEQDRNALALLVGAPVPDDLLAPAMPLPPKVVSAEVNPSPTAALVKTAPAGDELAAVPVALDSSVLQRRPDVQQAEQGLIAANANIGAARAAFFPRIALTTSAGLVSNQLSNLLEAGSFAWTLAPQAVMTIFDYGRNKANLEVSKVNRDIAVAQYEKSVQSAFRDTADALAGRATWQRQLDAAQQQWVAASDIARLTELKYTRGAASELERLDAQRSLFAAEQSVVQLRLAEQLNRVAVFKALGG